MGGATPPIGRLTAEVVPFPARAQRARIAKTAAYMVGLSRKHAEAHLQEQIRRQRESLERKGVQPNRVAAEMASFQGAVRAALWRALITGDGVA